MSAGAAPPRLVYFINGFAPGGAEAGLLHMLKGGAFDGFDVTIASIGGGPLKSAFGAWRVVQLSRSDEVTSASAAASAFRLWRLLASARPAVLVLSLPQANIIGRVIGALAGVKTIVSFEHNDTLARPIYTQLFRATSGVVDVVLADCAQTMEVTARKHYRRAPGARFVTPLVSFEEAPAQRVAAVAPSFVAVGRLTRVKNHALAIEALALLREAEPQARLTIFGDGPERGALEQLVAERGLGDFVSLPGFQPEWWARGPFSGLVLTSLHEGLCIVAAEAMWAGIPVISRRIGGLRDYADDASMYAYGDLDAAAVAAQMRRAIARAPQHDCVTRRARGRVQEMFGRGAVLARYRELNAALHDRARLALAAKND